MVIFLGVVVMHFNGAEILIIEPRSQKTINDVNLILPYKTSETFEFSKKNKLIFIIKGVKNL